MFLCSLFFILIGKRIFKVKKQTVSIAIALALSSSMATAEFLDNNNQVRGTNIVGGSDNVVQGQNNVVLGKNNNVLGDNIIAIGSNTSSPVRGITIGLDSASSLQGVSIGYGSKADGVGSIANGVSAVATGGSSIASGSFATADKMSGVALGQRSNAGEAYAVAIGGRAKATHGESVALGSASETKESKLITTATVGSMTYSGFAGANTDKTGVVSVGSSTNTRQIVNVGAGEISATSTDAINGSQLYAIAEKMNQGNIINNQVINNVNKNTYRIGNLENKVHKVDRRSRAGIAGVAAIASAPSARKDGKSMVSAGVANHRGESAVAIKASRNSDNGHWSSNINGAADTRGQFTVGAGLGYEW